MFYSRNQLPHHAGKIIELFLVSRIVLNKFRTFKPLRKFRSPTLSFFILVLLSGYSFAQNQDSIQWKINQAFETLLSDPQISSLSLGVVIGDKTYKFQDGELINDNQPNEKSIYEIASLTKTFTGLLLAHAIHEEKVSLDDDIRKYLPGEYPNLEFNQQAITFRHLITHTSGLPNMFPDKPEIFVDPNWDELPFIINKLQSGFSKIQFLNELSKVKLDTIPGYKLNYSNAGANLVGLCLENVYNQRYEEILEKILLDLLNMNHTYAGNMQYEKTDLVEGINLNGIKMPTRSAKYISAEGGILSTLEDMMLYMQFLLDDNSPLPKIAFQELFGGKYGNYENGIFWQMFKQENGSRKIFQNGGAFGTSSWLTLIPESKTGVFIVTNVAGQGIHQKLSECVDLILSKIKQ